MYVVSLISGLPIISKPLENNPDHLVWEALLSIDTHRSDDKTRKIPKSIFITPNLNESKGNCPPDHKLGPDGRCYKTLQIDPLLILKKQIESILKNNRTATTEYEDDYDYSEYGESTESMNSNGQYTVPLSLGFGSEGRIQQPQQTQHTTFPNLNRVVKDDSHVSPSVFTASNEKENQPFLVSTTGFGLGAEDAVAESKLEAIASVAAPPSTIPPTTTDVPTSVRSNSSPSSGPSSSPNPSPSPSSNPSPRSSQNPVIQQQSSIATTTAESVTEETEPVSSSTSDQQLSSSVSVSSSETPEASTMQSSSIKSLSSEDDSISGTINIENTTQPLDATTNENPNLGTNENLKRNTDTVSPLTTTIRSVETPENLSTPSSTEGIETITNDQIGFTEKSSKADVTLSSSEASIRELNQRSEKPNESGELELPTLPQTEFVEQNEKQQMYGSEINGTTSKADVLEIPSKPEVEETPSKLELEETTEKVIIVEPSLKLMDLKLESTERADSESKVFIVQAQSSTEPSITTPDAGQLHNGDSYEEIDAIFIPSQSESMEEIDPAIGKNVNVSVAEPRYRLDNSSEVSSDELPEAELAPIIDTGSDGRSNIELIKTSDEVSRAQFDDEKRNLSARLSEELLFQGASFTPLKFDEAATKPSRELDELVLNPAENERKRSALEEILSGGSLLAGSSGEVTTEEPIDYDSKEIKIPTESVVVDNVDYEGELPAKEAVAFSKPTHLFQGASFQSHTPVQTSVYSTFLNRLRVPPPFVNLHDRQSDTAQYSHSPFDIVPAIRSTGVDRRFNDPITTHSTFTISDTDHRFEPTTVQQPAPRAKSLQIGINCYLKNVTNKQQYIICDNE